MKAKNQRLVLALLAVVAIIGAALLAMSALKEQASQIQKVGDQLATYKPPAVSLPTIIRGADGFPRAGLDRLHWVRRGDSDQ